jgi:hypothetical protein
LTAIGKDFVAVLRTDRRGLIERRKATTRKLAFSLAHTLLDVAERRDWHPGEVVSVEMRQSDE